MSYCLERFQSTEAQGYTMNYGNLTPSNYGDIIVPNESIIQLSIFLIQIMTLENG